MQIILKGKRDGEPSDRLFAFPSMPIDYQAIRGPASKYRREDLQIQSFAFMLGFLYDCDAPVEICVGADPPDRLVRLPEGEIAVELTELTFPLIRRDFALARKLARNVGDALHKNRGAYPHLDGRSVHLSFVPSKELPRDTTAMINEILNILREDRGYVGEDWEGVDEPPQVYPGSHRGFYQRVEPVFVQVNKNGDSSDIPVLGSAQAEFRHSELVSALEERIAQKDIPKNELLLVSCGLPDEKGCVCPIDKVVFEEVRGLVGSLEFKPKFLKAIYLHLWATAEWVELFRAQDYQHRWPPRWPLS